MPNLSEVQDLSRVQAVFSHKPDMLSQYFRPEEVARFGSVARVFREANQSLKDPGLSKLTKKAFTTFYSKSFAATDYGLVYKRAYKLESVCRKQIELGEFPPYFEWNGEKFVSVLHAIAYYRFERLFSDMIKLCVEKAKVSPEFLRNFTRFLDDRGIMGTSLLRDILRYAKPEVLEASLALVPEFRATYEDCKHCGSLANLKLFMSRMPEADREPELLVGLSQDSYYLSLATLDGDTMPDGLYQTDNLFMRAIVSGNTALFDYTAGIITAGLHPAAAAHRLNNLLKVYGLVFSPSSGGHALCQAAASGSAEMVKKVLEHVKAIERSAMIQSPTDVGMQISLTPLEVVAMRGKAEALAAMFAYLTESEKAYQLRRKGESNGRTLLELAVESGDVATIAWIEQALQETEAGFAAIAQPDDPRLSRDELAKWNARLRGWKQDNDLIGSFFNSGEKPVIARIWGQASRDEKIHMLQDWRGAKGNSLLHLLARSGSGEAINYVLSVFDVNNPQDVALREALLFDKNHEEETPLTYAACYQNEEAFFSLLDCHQDEFQALRMTNNLGENSLQAGVGECMTHRKGMESYKCHGVSFLAYCLYQLRNRLSHDKLLHLISQINREGKSLLHYLANRDGKKELQECLAMLSPQERQDLLCRRDAQGKLPIEYADRRHSTMTIRCILRALPPELQAEQLSVVGINSAAFVSATPLADALGAVAPDGQASAAP